MSRCKACDTILNQGELSRIDRGTGNFIDLCSPCFSVSDRASHQYDIDASDFDVEFNDGQKVSSWLQ